MKEERKRCSICGECVDAEEIYVFDDHSLCIDCLEERTTLCYHCGKRIWRDDNYGDRSTPLCESCYDECYTTCTRCDSVIRRDYAYYEHDDSDDPYCETCYNRYCSTKSIHDYYYKPEPIFYDSGNRFFGVELEVDNAGEIDENAESVMHIANGNGLEHVYCKHDGSLDEGFEIVTHPMTLNYHINEMPWKGMLTRLKNLSYLSHQAGTCGLHVHVNRDSLGETYEDQEACIARILFFVEKHWEELLKFSRRTNSQLNRWAARYGYKDRPKDILDHAKCGGNNGRYYCINLENSNTIEFRMFRGTLKYNTIIATLQLVNRVCDVAFALSDEEIKNLSWTSFVSGCTEPELIQYLKERRIYINEPVESEEDL